jgi:LacI family transcriptional regulator
VASTIKDVAKRAGVSVITVSRVVTGSSYVSASTRARVEAAIEELHYVPNQMASNLRSRQSDTLALLLPDITNSFWTTIARGVEDEAWARGYGLFLCNTDDDPEKEARYIDILLRRQVEGVLIVPTIGGLQSLQRLRERHIKFVVIHRTLEGIDATAVRNDSRGGTRDLTRALIANGWRRIGYIGGPLWVAFGRDRLAGYEEAMRDAGLAIDEDLIKVGPYGAATGYEKTMELVQSRPRPEALVIGNSRLAMGALQALEDARIRVPEDLSVASFHDITTLDQYAPRMITAVQPAYDLGLLGVRHLFESGAGEEGSHQEIVLPNRIIIPEMPTADRHHADLAADG